RDKKLSIMAAPATFPSLPGRTWRPRSQRQHDYPRCERLDRQEPHTAYNLFFRYLAERCSNDKQSQAVPRRLGTGISVKSSPVPATRPARRTRTVAGVNGLLRYVEGEIP